MLLALISLAVGFVAGVLVGRHNAKKATQLADALGKAVSAAEAAAKKL